MDMFNIAKTGFLTKMFLMIFSMKVRSTFKS